VCLLLTWGIRGRAQTTVNWWDAKGREKIEAAVKGLPSVHMFGKVVDADDNSVQGAHVSVRWNELIGSTDFKQRQLSVIADEKGRFEAICARPFVHISAIATKEGYAPSEWTSIQVETRQTTEDSPILLVLRKKEPLSFLLKQSPSSRSVVFWHDKTTQVTAVLDVLSKVGEGERTVRGEYAGLFIEASQKTMEDDWKVTVSVTNTTEGLVLCERYPYTAPETGYVQQCGFSVPCGQSVAKVFCLKNRSPAFFSRVTLDFGDLQLKKISPGFRCLFDITVNPYGERTFEYDERVDQFWREKPQWVEDAKAALREGRYPGKIDIDALIKAEQETGKK
jgi:hypothetical protein